MADAILIIPIHLSSLFAVFCHFYLFIFIFIKTKTCLSYHNRIEDCLQNQGWVLACPTQYHFWPQSLLLPLLAPLRTNPCPKHNQHNSKRAVGVAKLNLDLHHTNQCRTTHLRTPPPERDMQDMKVQLLLRSQPFQNKTPQ